MKKYCAVVVTLNRLNLLKLAINKLEAQTHPLDNIVIVDNASTDGTIDYLKTIESNKIKVIYNKTNEGGAGGFYRGIKAAYELGSDYFWIMDDDTIATPTALEELIKGFVALKNEPVGFITSNVLYKDGKPCLMNISNCEWIWNEYIKDGLIRVSHCSFVSMMIPRDVVRDIGLPFKEFFIWGDDGEYSTRIAKKYQGYISANSVVYHFMNENKGVDIFNTPTDRIGRFYYFYRNWMFTHKFRGEGEARQYLREIKALIGRIRHSRTPNKREKIRTIKRGIKDGKKMVAKIDFPNGKESIGGVEKQSITQRGKTKLKRMIKDLLFKIDKPCNRKFSHTLKVYRMEKRIPRSLGWKLNFFVKGLLYARVYDAPNKANAFAELLNHVRIDCNTNKRFFSSIDIYKTWEQHGRQMDNCPSDYSLFINNSLRQLMYEGEELTEFEKDNNVVIGAIIDYINRVVKKLKISTNKNKKNIIAWLNNFIDQPAKGVEDALQRVILINQLLWQTGHRLVGYGRLDLILDGVLKQSNISDDELRDIICDFLAAQHNYYVFKSDALVGDTGQIIILGGLDCNDNYFHNRLTLQFIRAIEKMQLPDPKVLLRVCNDTPLYLWEAAIKCASTGIGCPLFSNDDRVVPALISYGYEKEDSFNYTTSACWEPIPGKCYEQNNIGLINFAAPFDLISQKDDLDSIASFDEYLWYYCIHLKGHAMYVARKLDEIEWAKDPFMSATAKAYRENGADISMGSGKYNNYGILSIGFSNAINSLINIQEYVFNQKLFTLKELNEMRLNNFVGREDVVILLRNSSEKFGKDNRKIEELCNYILRDLDEELSCYRNKFGGHVKFGLSSPSYLTIGKLSPATFDGRRENESYGVHISADSGVAYTELMEFSSKLDYNKGRLNGNVVDMMVSPDFIQKNFDKFQFFMIKNIKKGVYQLQLNVVSSEMLKRAKADRNYMPNLIVRVWGFSAYFNQLPEEYQDMLIERAVKNESNNN